MSKTKVALDEARIRAWAVYQAAYDEALAQARAVYDEVRAPALAAYQAAVPPERRDRHGRLVAE